MFGLRMFLLLCLLGGAHPCLGGVITVDPSGSGDYLTLPEAWGPAAATDTILMMAGTHLVGHGQAGWPLTLDSDSPTVVGPEPPGEAVLLGDRATRAFCIPEDTDNARMRFHHLTFRDIGDVLSRADPSGGDGGRLIFTDNIVEGCGATSFGDRALDASHCGQNSVVARNVFRSNPGTALYLWFNSGLIEDNEVCYNTLGIIAVPDGWPTIERNHVHHNTGLGIGTSFDDRVMDNLIEYNGHGLSVYYCGFFTGNVIRYNTLGVRVGYPEALFQGNDIYGNITYNMQVRDFITGSAWTWDCTMNWWGTTDPAAIAASIWDRNDNPELSVIVEFDPWCVAEGCEPTSVQESSWGAIKALFR